MGSFENMQRILWICLAGALGTGTRYLVGVWAADKLGGAFPYATLIVNVAGCFLIGAVAQAALSIADFPVNLRFALSTGFLGGLTTYSSFALETTKLAEQGRVGAALLNFGATTLTCFGAVLLGATLARAWLPT
jgi:CrcB protein